MVISLGILGNLGPLAFHFFPSWNNKEAPKQIIEKSLSRKIIGSPNFICETKLKVVKNELKVWAKINHNELQNGNNKLKKEMDSIEENK